ncbi:hypothetical protein Hamer_G029018, partial [Homarus americanus]
ESGEEEDKEESRIILAKDLKDAFFCWSKLSKLAEDYHPDVGSVQKAISVFNDNVRNYFWKAQKSRRTMMMFTDTFNYAIILIMRQVFPSLGAGNDVRHGNKGIPMSYDQPSPGSSSWTTERVNWASPLVVPSGFLEF